MYGHITECSRLCWKAWHKANTGSEPPFDLETAPAIEAAWVSTWMHMENYFEAMEGKSYEEISTVAEAAFASYAEREPLWDTLPAREKLSWQAAVRLFHNLYELEDTDRSFDGSGSFADSTGMHHSVKYAGRGVDAELDVMVDDAKAWVDKQLGVEDERYNLDPTPDPEREAAVADIRQSKAPAKRKRGRPKGSKDTRKRKVRKPASRSR